MMHNPFEEIINRLTVIENLLTNQTFTQVKEVKVCDWMSIQELSDYLPGKPTLSQIYNWTHRRVIPAHKMGRRLSFLKSEIDLWLKNNYQMTQTEIDMTAEIFIKRNKVNRK
jgi:excisionase family DNA binding protein